MQFKTWREFFEARKELQDAVSWAEKYYWIKARLMEEVVVKGHDSFLGLPCDLPLKDKGE